MILFFNLGIKYSNNNRSSSAYAKDDEEGSEVKNNPKVPIPPNNSLDGRITYTDNEEEFMKEIAKKYINQIDKN